MDYCKDSNRALSHVHSLCQRGEMFRILCAGCGEDHYVDWMGYRVDWSEDKQAFIRRPENEGKVDFADRPRD